MNSMNMMTEVTIKKADAKQQTPVGVREVNVQDKDTGKQANCYGEEGVGIVDYTPSEVMDGPVPRRQEDCRQIACPLLPVEAQRDLINQVQHGSVYRHSNYYVASQLLVNGEDGQKSEAEHHEDRHHSGVDDVRGW